MKVSDYNYILPKEFIAQKPQLKRDDCKLMILDRMRKTIYHRKFLDIIEFINKDDIIVLNNTKVFPAKLIGQKSDTGGKLEILLVSKTDNNKEIWRVLINKKKSLKEGSEIVFNEEYLKARIISRENDEFIIEFINNSSQPFTQIMEEIGKAPLPPYIKRDYNNIEITNEDKFNYQTVYAKFERSIAAPTAGFHFTGELLEKLRKKGISVVEITHHIGKGTFIPIKTTHIEEHVMDKEYYEISKETTERINKAKMNGKKVIAVGTSTTRALETAAISENRVKTIKEWSNLFIYESYKFKMVDNLVTNFHLPKSTNLILTCTFGGKDVIMNCYNEALKNGYKFYSYGDAMLII